MFDLESKKKYKSPITSPSISSILDTPRKVSIKSELHKCRKRLIRKEKVKLKEKKSRVKAMYKRFKLDSNLCQDLSTYINPTELFNSSCLNSVK